MALQLDSKVTQERWHSPQSALHTVCTSGPMERQWGDRVKSRSMALEDLNWNHSSAT